MTAQKLLKILLICFICFSQRMVNFYCFISNSMIKIFFNITYKTQITYKKIKFHNLIFIQFLEKLMPYLKAVLHLCWKYVFITSSLREDTHSLYFESPGIVLILFPLKGNLFLLNNWNIQQSYLVQGPMSTHNFFSFFNVL